VHHCGSWIQLTSSCREWPNRQWLAVTLIRNSLKLCESVNWPSFWGGGHAFKFNLKFVSILHFFRLNDFLGILYCFYSEIFQLASSFKMFLKSLNEFPSSIPCMLHTPPISLSFTLSLLRGDAYCYAIVSTSLPYIAFHTRTYIPLLNLTRSVLLSCCKKIWCQLLKMCQCL
jgi:hypothetical protein